MSSKYAYQKEFSELYLANALDGADLGEQIRKQVKKLTNPAGLTNEANEQLGKQIDALERISNNVYANKYKRIHTSTATGMTAEQCNQVLSSEFLQYLNDESEKKNRK